MCGKARPLESASCLADTEQLQLGSSLHRPSAGRLQITEIEDVEGLLQKHHTFPCSMLKRFMWPACGLPVTEKAVLLSQYIKSIGANLPDVLGSGQHSASREYAAQSLQKTSTLP